MQCGWDTLTARQGTCNPGLKRMCPFSNTDSGQASGMMVVRTTASEA